VIVSPERATNRGSNACNRLLLGSRDARPSHRHRPHLGRGAVERDEHPGQLAASVPAEFAAKAHEDLLFIGTTADPL
jgi:hypothetical protein